MPTLNITLSVPTQSEVDDFCLANGYTTGVKSDFIKATIASYVKNKIKSYRVNKARQSADVTIKQVSDSVTILDIS